MLAVGRDALGQRPAKRDDPRLRAPRAQHARLGCPERDQADAPRAAHAEAAEHQRDALRDIGLQPPRGAERHRRRDVQHDPGRQRAIGNMQTNVRLAAATSRRRRVDVPDVVADLVRAQLRQLHPDADAGGTAVAGQRTRDQPVDGDVERLDQGLR